MLRAMGDYGRMVEDALFWTLMLGMAVGAASILGGWALWHYVLSHVVITWR